MKDKGFCEANNIKTPYPSTIEGAEKLFEEVLWKMIRSFAQLTISDGNITRTYEDFEQSGKKQPLKLKRTAEFKVKKLV